MDSTENDQPMDVIGTTENGTKETRSNLISHNSLSTIDVLLHPSVIFHISDHWTRRKAQEGCEQVATGALIGKQTGKQVEIMNAFELDFTVFENETILNRDYYNQKEKHFKQIFSNLEFLGWYTTGDSLSENHLKIHKQFFDINEFPVFLLMSPNSKNTTELPISIYESVIDIVNGETQLFFVPLVYNLTTDEAERIGIDHIARLCSNSSTSESSVAEQLTAQHITIKMLYSRIRIILAYLKAVQRRELNKNQEVLREIYSLVNRLPIVQTERFKRESNNQNNEVHLLTLMGVMTKGCNELNQMINKLSLLFDDNKSLLRRSRITFPA